MKLRKADIVVPGFVLSLTELEVDRLVDVLQSRSACAEEEAWTLADLLRSQLLRCKLGLDPE